MAERKERACVVRPNGTNIAVNLFNVHVYSGQCKYAYTKTAQTKKATTTTTRTNRHKFTWTQLEDGGANKIIFI